MVTKDISNSIGVKTVENDKNNISEASKKQQSSAIFPESGFSITTNTQSFQDRERGASPRTRITKQKDTKVHLQKSLLKDDKIRLIETSFQGLSRKMILTHYAGSKAVMGRQILYEIYYKGQQVGIIGLQASSSIMKNVHKAVYGTIKTTKESRIRYFNEVYNNNIFRLEYIEKNLASRILSQFKKQVKQDFEKKYKGVTLKAIVSMSFGENKEGETRKGMCYKADNWLSCGLTSGFKKIMIDFKNNKFRYEPSEKKNIWLWLYETKKEKREREKKFNITEASEKQSSSAIFFSKEDFLLCPQCNYSTLRLERQEENRWKDASCWRCGFLVKNPHYSNETKTIS